MVHDALEMIGVRLGVVGLVVDAHHDRDVLVLRRRRDDHLLRPAGVDVGARLGGVGEEAGRLDHHSTPMVGPLQRGRVTLGERPGSPGRRPRWRRRSELTSASSRPRMVSNFSRWASVALSVRSLTATISRSRPTGSDGAEKVAADPAEAVDTYTNGHLGSPGRGGGCSVTRLDGSTGVQSPARTRAYRHAFERQRPVPRYVPVTPTQSVSGVLGEHLGVSDASVSGMSSSSARLSAIASSRRIRPAIASLVKTGSCS